MTNNIQFKVCVRCFTYNHSKFICETLNGFAMQQTPFPFVCVIVDDASTDGEPEVIRRYMKENFDLTASQVLRQEDTDDYTKTFAQHKENANCYFAVYLLKYNHYSIKPKIPYFKEFIEGVDYHALCEGDDYWIDPLKLQHQVDYMENHPNCTMTCTRAKRYSESKGKYVGEQYCRKSDGILSPIDIINRTGLYIPTCSIVFRPWIKENYPNYCHNCKVGDYPLQITAAMKGSVYYFNKSMCVYRVGNKGSWIGRQKTESVDPARLEVVCGQKKMFEGFAKNYPKYKIVLRDKISEHILKNMPKRSDCSSDDLLMYQELFSEELGNLKLKWKIFYLICKSRIPYVKFYYRKILLRNYRDKRLSYDSLIKRLMFRFKVER